MKQHPMSLNFLPSWSYIAHLMTYFFTPNKELGMTFLEMWKVSRLLIGNYPYEKYFLTDDVHQIIKTNNSSMCLTLWELACHFHIRDNLIVAKDNYMWYEKWVDYFYTNLDSKGVIGLRK